MPIVSTTKMTARQFLQLGEDPVGVRLELVDGAVAVGPSWDPSHSQAVVQLISALGTAASNSGELYSGVNWCLGEFDVRRPDVQYYAKSRRHFVGEKAMEGPPDLAVEVVSPSSVEIDRNDKFIQYRTAGVPHYWMVDPARQTVEAWTLSDGEYVLAGCGQDRGDIRLPPFVELAIPIERLWRD